mgnify:CR=1 FL=1
MFLKIENGMLHIMTQYGILKEKGLEYVQELVGGRVETVPVPSVIEGRDLVGYCNADASNLRPTCRVEGYKGVIFGPLVVVGVDEEGGLRPMDFQKECGFFELIYEEGEVFPILRRRTESWMSRE